MEFNSDFPPKMAIEGEYLGKRKFDVRDFERDEALDDDFESFLALSNAKLGISTQQNPSRAEGWSPLLGNLLRHSFIPHIRTLSLLSESAYICAILLLLTLVKYEIKLKFVSGAKSIKNSLIKLPTDEGAVIDGNTISEKDSELESDSILDIMILKIFLNKWFNIKINLNDKYLIIIR